MPVKVTLSSPFLQVVLFQPTIVDDFERVRGVLDALQYDAFAQYGLVEAVAFRQL
jgi:hypothetical protein